MKIDKKDVLKALEHITVPGEGKNMVESGAVTNIQIFGDEVEVDITIANPSLQARKKTEVEILKVIHREVYEKAKIKINIKVEAPAAKPKVNEIKGKPIPGINNIIAVASGKGGVGKSTVTANLAVTLAKMGFKVGLLDADIYGPSMPIMFDVANEKPLAVNVEGKSKMKPVENYGVKLLSIGFFTQRDQAVIWRGPMASKALNQMIFDAHWGELDFMLIDLPPGTGDIHLSIMQSLPVTGAVVVSTPQEVALADARKGVAMFQQDSINVPVLGIVENMAYFTPAELPENKYYIFGKEGAKNLAEDLNVPFLGEMPLVQSIREAGDVGRPAALQTATPVEKAFEELTKQVVSEVVARNKTMPPTEAIKITTMAGCSPVNKK
ncbi:MULTISPECIES: Mrp/NBP35 family ATP-binding protein [Maribacter]|mgnify:FL=1|jgi:ATP-binding protein involved in chromosome partitioning|uniref:Iron-sulfur cluster carrier protein n=1 Tax=Maribacter dokdonensis TaxID=320912 RepID=A0A1H4K5M9_9FLAO|nr:MULTISPECIES: Mrp/NBP35 family ATP-binding protein [Maribacter]HAF76519.1 MRP family ATP-binding protein [Maribacter sp.]APA63921.1 chromosome partitioning protein [Maribacter sp. 1_2014MBL_MicDiv]MBU2901000.1 Mrp/NBP35 family ATP-binding protein [Maribacter dokdonensis]MDF4220615.1 Mrp/NBP35 family ATP-binding protein [Maribacter huludaoensis]CAG2534214.1 ATP-binding protein involved in chromosome partitioning [Maribacter dokdonensis]|tara:strand:- start:844 stop:1986 length:1143 start_codon:yes stop_codon:yes gene_type:complete